MRLRRRGFALIIALIAAGAVFTLGMRSAASSRAMQIESRLIEERVTAERLARAAACLALKGISIPGKPQDRSLADAGTSSSSGFDPGPAPAVAAASPEEEDKGPDLPAILKEMLGQQAEPIKKAEDQAAAAGGLRIADGGGLTGRVKPTAGLGLLKTVGLPSRPIEVTVDTTIFRVTMSDATGLLNVNRVDADRFRRYLVLKGIDAPRAGAIADELLDWRDTDDISRPQGAEAPAYASRGLVPRNAEVFALEELLYLPSMTRDIYDLIRADLCAGGDGKAHLGSASAAVLASIDGLTTSAVEDLLTLRAAGTLTPESAASALKNAWDRAKNEVRFEPSGFVRLLVEPVARLDKDNNRTAILESRRFEGVAVVSDNGTIEVGLRSL